MGVRQENGAQNGLLYNFENGALVVGAVCVDDSKRRLGGIAQVWTRKRAAIKLDLLSGIGNLLPALSL